MRHQSPIRRCALTGRALVAALAASWALISPAAAQDDEDAGEYSQPGLYIGGMGVYGIELFDDLGGVGADNSWGANARIGYRMLPNLAVEQQFEWLNEAELTWNEQNTDGRVTLWNTTTNAKLFLLTERFQPYALLGAGYGRVKTKLDPTNKEDDGAVVRLGGGFDLYANREVGLSFEGAYIQPTNAIDDTAYFSFGLGIFIRFYPLD